MRFHGYDLEPTSIPHSLPPLPSRATTSNHNTSSPKIDEETQRLIEPVELHLPTTASLPKRRLSPPHAINAMKSPRKARSTTMPKVATNQPAQSATSHQQEDRNAFEEGFTAALSHPHPTYDGQYDNDDEYGDCTPLLNSYYNDTQHQPQPAIPKPPRHHAPLEPARKSKPSRSICLWHEISHSSQYTRPAAEILREVLEDRYPVVVSREVQQSAEAGGPVGGDRRQWWRRVMRRGGMRWSEWAGG